MAGTEILIEFHQVGNAVKVTAVDPVTLVEVSIVGPVAASQSQLERAAIEKLRYVQRARRGGAAAPPAADKAVSAAPPEAPGRGLIA